MLQKTKAGRAKTSVTINLQDETGCRIVPSYDDYSTIKVTCHQLLNIAILDMENAYFKINEEFIRQIFENPQGSPL